jgi:hypothetical protein
MGQFKTVVMFVRMLSTGSSGAEPSLGKVVFGSTIETSDIGGQTLENADRYGRRVDTSASFCWWYALDAVTARFLLKTLYVGGLDGDEIIGHREGILSGLAVQESRIGVGQVAHEEFRVCPAFAGSDLDDHFILPK